MGSLPVRQPCLANVGADRAVPAGMAETDVRRSPTCPGVYTPSMTGAALFIGADRGYPPVPGAGRQSGSCLPPSVPTRAVSPVPDFGGWVYYRPAGVLSLESRLWETSMAIRHAVADFLAAGPLPDEDQPVEAIERAEELLDRIEAPVTSEEAMALLAGFGPDNCYGLAWTLLHLIETAPGAPTFEYPADAENEWVQRLRGRVANARLIAGE